VHEINLATGADFLFAFKALKQAYSELRNYFNNAEGEQKDQPDAEVILRTFLGC
jgi:hemoglobin-like flavoprotein